MMLIYCNLVELKKIKKSMEQQQQKKRDKKCI